MGARREELASIDRLTRRFLAVMQEAQVAMNYRVVGDLALVLELLEGRRKQLTKPKGRERVGRAREAVMYGPQPQHRRRRFWWFW